MDFSIGIDLGTTFSAVAFIEPVTKLPKVIPNREGNKITPSVIQFIDGNPIFGSEAESALSAGETGCVATFKREMGNAAPYCTIDGTSYTAEELSALLLRHLKEDAEFELGDTIKDAVITVPAYFYSLEREATIRAAEAAGLKVKKIIDEPNAAAMAYGLGNWRENANILVYDLGGGTFDVTLTRMGRNGELITIATRGDHKLGGRDWDNRIEDMLIDLFEQETGLSIRTDARLKQILRGMTEGVKKQFSAMATTKTTASFPNYGKDIVEISRSAFNENTADLLDRTGALYQAVIAEARLGIRDITDVLLVGGSTRMPQVSSYITNLFGKKPITHVNPDEAVALGAAIQSSKENGSYATLSVQVLDGKKVTDRSSIGLMTKSVVRPTSKLSGIGSLQVRETTAHAMGMIAVNPEQTKYINDIIIPANHPRPVRAAKAFTQRTRVQSGNEMEIFVLQGDNENPLDNQVPFRYVVSGIRHIPGQRNRTLIRVQYSYDHNGVINVEARQEQHNVNLPIRREPVPENMSMYGLSIDAITAAKISASTSDSIGVYSKWAGVNRIPTASADKYGNAVGDELDLVEDGTFDNEAIYVLNLCHRECSLSSPNAALSKKGFKVIEDITVPSIDVFKAHMDEASQFWLISDCTGYLSDEHLDLIEDYFNQGHGVYIWGDNDPYYVDANKVALRLFGITMSGNSPGAQVVSLCEKGKSIGVVPNHLISTGVVNIFEGRTIAEVQTSDEVEPLIFGSDGKVVAACYDDDGKRAIIDGGFTRLYCDWESAGTDRYIVNAAAWLVNLERFAKKQPQSDSKDNNQTSGIEREVEAWDD